MKRFKRAAALLLALSMLAAAGCTDKPEETSSAAESGSSDNSDTSPEPFVEPEVNEVRDTIDALYGTPADRSLKANNVLSGMLPAFSRPASSEYPGNGGKALTDGVRVQAFDSTAWVGFNGREPVTLTFDLGEVVDGLADFEVGAFKSEGYGIGLPTKVAVSVSTDGENYVQIGATLAPNQLSSTEAYSFMLRLAGTVSARYIRYEIGAPSNTWLFIDEVTAVRYGAGADGPTSGEVGDYYGDTNIPEITEPEYWDPSESDYTQKLNLIAGLPQQIEQLAPFSAEVATTFYNSKEDAAMLTDGKFAGQAAYSDPAYFRFTGGLGRTILYDLGRESAVSSFAGSFLYELSTAVGLPRRLLIKASQNGVDWQTIHVTEAFKTSETAARVEVAEAFAQTYRARYIEFVFPVNTHVYCDELAVYGTKRIPDDAADIVADEAEDTIYPDKYITPDDFLGVNNMLLSYHCLPNDLEGGRITVEEYLPHVGYFDREGKLTDTFFDSFLYLPYTAFNYSDNAKSLDGWKFYIENQFTADRNVDALNTAVGQVKEELGLDDYTVSVFFSILYTFTESTSFGDIDGDGVVENFTKIEDRKKAIKWIIDEQVRLFEQGNYENLELYGFYWFEEAITFSDPHETELIRYASDYLHSLGYKLMWIPYYQASGFSDWKELGFDMACMQPNYAFSGQATIDRLYDNAATTKRLGMCVEIEINQYDSKADILRYKEYLAVGAETGYMNAVKCYYQGGVPGAFYYAYKSTDPLINSVYHDTYLFAKGKYDPSEIIDGEIADPSDLEMDTTSGRGVTGSLNVETESDYRVRIETSPKYGTVRLESNGTVTYTPLSGFAGTDTFTVYLEYIHGDSKTATVTVRVHEK